MPATRRTPPRRVYLVAELSTYGANRKDQTTSMARARIGAVVQFGQLCILQWHQWERSERPRGARNALLTTPIEPRACSFSHVFSRRLSRRSARAYFTSDDREGPDFSYFADHACRDSRDCRASAREIGEWVKSGRCEGGLVSSSAAGQGRGKKRAKRRCRGSVRARTVVRLAPVELSLSFHRSYRFSTASSVSATGYTYRGTGRESFPDFWPCLSSRYHANPRDERHPNDPIAE